MYETLTHPVDGDPEFAALHRANPERYPFLLQSTASAGSLGRFEILFAFPGEVIESCGERRFLTDLDTAFEAGRRTSPDSTLPFSGGWFLYLGYELAGDIEPALALEPDPLLPRAFAVRCPAALVRDLDDGSVTLVAETGASVDPRLVQADIAALEHQSSHSAGVDLLAIHEEPPERFLEAVEAAKLRIAAGDIYQANLSREWQLSALDRIDCVSLFRALARANPAPFAGMIHWRGIEVVSSSPERLVSVRDGVVSTRPIAGTRPRSDDLAQDRALLEELIAHPKERAEHVMLIDLERNDLGRVCVPGSVGVDEMMVIETYAHVHHIVSNVRGQLREGVTPGDIIAAVFPGGTITGCPKVRCMEIISELEGGSRGAYTGSFGYLNRDGSMDINILIRSIVVNGTEASFRAGAGIVADSEPMAELEETRAKAKGLLKALGL